MHPFWPSAVLAGNVVPRFQGRSERSERAERSERSEQCSEHSWRCVGCHHSKPKSKLTSPNFNMLTFDVLVRFWQFLNWFWSMLAKPILATYPVAALDVTVRNQNQNWHPQISTCWLFVVLANFGQIWANVEQMFRTIWGQSCSERSERSARSERSEHEHCSGPTQREPIVKCFDWTSSQMTCTRSPILSTLSRQKRI